MTNSAVASGVFNIISGDWYSIGGLWAHRKKITIDYTKVSGGSSLSNFPILVSWASDSNVAASARSDGNDILFTGSDGLTKLDHEIESYNSSTGAMVAWVRIPSLSSSANTEIYVYYGNVSASNQQNKTGVWSNGYLGVWHMGEASGTSLSDSSSYANNASKSSATDPNPTGSGKIHGAQNFDSSGDKTQVPADAEFNTTNFSIQAWLYPTSTGDFRRILQVPPSVGSRPALISSYGVLKLSVAGTEYTSISGSNLPTNQWSLVTLTYSGGTPALYVNGQNQSIQAQYVGIYQEPSSYITIASRPDNMSSFGGTVDDVRYSNVARTAGWVATEYNNHNSPSTFYSVGAEQ